MDAFPVHAPTLVLRRHGFQVRPNPPHRSAGIEGRPMKLARPLPALAAAVLVWPASAGAHANLVRSVPADGAVVAHAPREVRLVFDDIMRPLPGANAVRNGGGPVLRGRRRRRSARVLVFP